MFGRRVEHASSREVVIMDGETEFIIQNTRSGPKIVFKNYWGFSSPPSFTDVQKENILSDAAEAMSHCSEY